MKRTFKHVNIYPTNEFPFGRKGYTLTRLWETAKESHTQGMLILDGDVAIDPIDFDVMYRAMRSAPTAIHIGPARIWPVSTGYSTSVWAHRKFGTSFAEWQEFRTEVDTASFCFTYLPATLINGCISNGMENWTYPNVDKTVFEHARKMEIRFHVVDGCMPKHMHY